ncbi:hypothetical protein [Sebaldella sp. S0638]|uniref:hypothetical protein n=1 Tax=Sebaldella sp. S0638 TaxID=2957809 RepID=UPI0020A05143|nr:hypothetical protein [Sebaldella sp. S0638]MCP1225780.1 hypothetical protein [Sebaldella sp. S0638]
MAKPRRKSIKERLDETEKELEKLKEQYSEEIKSKTHNIFVKNKLESLLDDENYLKVLEEAIIKSANTYKTTHQNNNL